jgi:hypothetical protein
VPQKARLSGLAVLHTFVSANLAAIEKQLESDRAGDELLEELKSVLAELNEDSV